MFGQIDAFGGGRTMPPLREEFIAPPFDVIDGRCEEWKVRKRQWLSLGIQSEKGRQGHEAWNSRALSNGLDGWLKAADNANGRTDFAHGWLQHDVSVFDPVLAEVLIHWYSKPGALVFDPFAGGSIRGIVAERMGRDYYGIDLSENQCEENRWKEARPRLSIRSDFQKMSLIAIARSAA